MEKKSKEINSRENQELIALIESNYVGKKLLNELDSSIGDNFEYIKNGKNIFIQSLTLLINYFRSVSKGHTHGAKDISIKFLFSRCISDLIAGFHLANHCYVNQFYSVTRPILETLDLISLFIKDDNYAKLWADDENKFAQEYKPKKIRQLINIPGFDPLYSFFCQSGSHPTLEGIKSNVYIRKEKKRGSTPNLVIHLGPTNLFIPIIFSFIFSYLLLLKISESMAKYFRKKSIQNSEELIRVIINNHKKFLMNVYYMDFNLME